MVVPPTALNTLRKEMRQRRLDIAAKQKSMPFRVHATLTDLLRNANIIGLYVPMGGEPDPFALLDGYSGSTALPAVATSTLMTFRNWRQGQPLTATSWGGQQPPDTAALVEPDVILVPLLGFDAAFNRIGQGGGYYDRYLAANPSACRIGVAWEGQRLAHIDPRAWDVPMDAIITETDFHVKDLTRCQSR